MNLLEPPGVEQHNIVEQRNVNTVEQHNIVEQRNVNAVEQRNEAETMEEIVNEENIEEMFRVFVTNALIQETLIRFMDDLASKKRKLDDEKNKESILNFLYEKVDMIKLETVEKKCSICEEMCQMVETKCCSFRQCKKCFLQWMYKKEVFTCPQCRCETHENIDNRIFLLMKN